MDDRTHRVQLERPVRRCPRCDSDRCTPEELLTLDDVIPLMNEKDMVYVTCRDCGREHEQLVTVVERLSKETAR